ncbi:hypothetical protein [Dongia sp.]|uniref:hypothetical protein n=1 Tax=Dongia sp. TaxID=1977262 RepID=UPI003751111D
MGIRFGRLALASALVFAALPAFASPVTLNAVDQPGGAVLNEAVQWRVMRLDNQGKEVPTPAAVGNDPVLKAELSPGHYMIQAIRGTINIKQGLVVGSAAETRNIVVSNANAAVKATNLGTAVATASSGAPATAVVQPLVQKPAAPAAKPAQVIVKPNTKLTIGMIPNSGRGAINDPIAWQVFTYSKGVTENGQLVAEKTAPSATFNLPAGSYVVRAAYKGTQSDLVIPLAPNQAYTYTINLYAGNAKLSAANVGGTTIKKGLAWQIVRAKPAADGSYQLVTSSADASPQLLIREGNYLVVARQGDLWGVEKLSIKAGRTTSVKVKLKKAEGAPTVLADAQ